MELAGMNHAMDRFVFRESVAFTSGVSYERRRMGERLRARSNEIDLLHETFGKPGYRITVAELRRLASELEELN
jgi:hypothetical protein